MNATVKTVIDILHKLRRKFCKQKKVFGNIILPPMKILKSHSLNPKQILDHAEEYDQLFLLR